MAFDAANTKCFKGEPTTNLVNPSFSAWGTDGSGQGSVGTRTIISDYYCRITDVSSNTRQSIYIYSTTASTTYTFSVKYRKISGTPTLRFQLQSYNGGTFVSSVFPTTAQLGIVDSYEWQVAYYSFTTAAGTDRVLWFMQDGDDYTTYTHTFELKEPQMEAKTYYTPFVSGSRGTTVATGGGMYDLSQTGNHGELVNGPTYNTGSGGNILFDGTDDYINVPYNASTISFPHNSATICAWYRVSTSGDASGCLVTQRSSGGSGFQTYVLSNKLYADGGGTGGIYSTITGVAGTIYFGTIVFDKLSAQLKLYVNGEYNTQTSYTGTIQDTYPIRIGNGAFGDGPFPGHIYMASVYNRALSADEIRRIYNSTKSRFGL